MIILCATDTIKSRMKVAFSKLKVNVHITKCGISGPPGTGKTHIKALLLNQDRPPQRSSTAMSTRAEEITTAEFLVNSVEMRRGLRWTVLQKDHWARLLANTVYNFSNNLDEIMRPIMGSNDELEYKDLSSRTYKLLVKMYKDGKPKRKRKTVNDIYLIYLVDTGGQPQFQEILPNFVQCSVNFLVHNLSQDLNDYPKFEYVVDGNSCMAPECLKASNLSIIEQSVRSISSSVKSEKFDQISPTIAILGTFHDKFFEENCGRDSDRQTEILRERSKLINEKVRNYVGRSIKKCTILKYPHDQQIIFPIDASKNGWNPKGSTIETLKNAVHEYSKKVKILDVQISYFVFLQNLKDFSTKYKKAYLYREEFQKIAQDSYVSLNERDIEDALCLFSDVNLILYFPDCTLLSNIVFMDPSFLYNKVTDIIVMSFECSDSVSPNSFASTGIFTSRHLDDLSSLQFNQDPNFTRKMFFSLLQDLFIIAKVDEDRYFMPCVLQLEDFDSLSEEAAKQEDDIKDRMANNNVSGPLIISFGDRISPRGLFCAMVAKLASNFGWKLDEGKGAVRRRNMIEFGVESSSTSLGTALLCGKQTHLEVYTTCEKINCSNIRKAILLSLYEAGCSLKFNFNAIDIHTGFYCNNCPDDPKHHTIVSQRKDSGKLQEKCKWQEKCSFNTRKRAVHLNHKQVGWFENPTHGWFDMIVYIFQNIFVYLPHKHYLSVQLFQIL